ncbi:MAG: Ig-like domain-containing protein [Planctomycetota bacterium]
MTITVNADDDAPTADAGSAQAVDELDTVTLSASGSDVEGQALTYTWTQVSGPTVVLSDVHSTTPTFTAPQGVSNTDVVFELAVSDGTNTSVDTVTITVHADDDAPTAEAGPTQVVNELDTVTLSASGSDVEGQALTYTWTQVGGPTVVLSDVHSTTPTFTAPEGVSNTDVVFELAVSDGTNTSVDTVTITVNADDDAPTADAGPTQVVNELDTVTLSASGSDVEGQALTYTWTQVSGPTVVLSDVHSTTPTFTAPEGVSNTDVVFELAVSDGTNTSVDTVTITVNADDDAPTADAGSTQVVNELDTVTLSASGSDVEGQALTYTWTQVGGPTVVLSDVHSTTPTFTAPEGVSNTDVVFELAVSDGTNTSVDTVKITVNADDDAPTADAGSAQVVDELDTVTLSASGSRRPRHVRDAGQWPHGRARELDDADVHGAAGVEQSCSRSRHEYVGRHHDHRQRRRRWRRRAIGTGRTPTRSSAWVRVKGPSYTWTQVSGPPSCSATRTRRRRRSRRRKAYPIPTSCSSSRSRTARIRRSTRSRSRSTRTTTRRRRMRGRRKS